jgi:hypothetical protein
LIPSEWIVLRVICVTLRCGTSHVTSNRKQVDHKILNQA